MRIELGGGKVIELVEGDITQQPLDAIVNAANSTLLGGGGVDGAIHRAGGPAIVEECIRVREKLGGYLPTGQAVATTAGRLPAKHIIHTVGPIYDDGRSGEPQMLASCHREALRVADDLGATSVAFPAISTGVYGYPLDAAANVALSSTADALRRCRNVSLVRFVLFAREALEAFTNAARRAWPKA